MDNVQLIPAPPMDLPEDIEEKIYQFPEIIKDKTQLISNLEKKVNNAKTAAERAKGMSDNMQGFKEKKFLGIKWKSGDTKTNIEGTQTVVKANSNALELASEAQELSFKFQQELASTTEYLFYLGCYNIAANESMIANLNKQLRGEGAKDVKLSENVKEQFRNVIKRLLEQKDVLYRQQKLEEKTKKTEEKNAELSSKLEKQEEHDKEHSRRIDSIDEELKQKHKIDDNQSKQIQDVYNKVSNLYEYRLNDQKEISTLVQQNAELTAKVKNYKWLLYATFAFSIISLTLSLIR